MKPQLASAFALVLAFALLVPSVESTRDEFEDYELEWEPPWEWFTWHRDDPTPTEPVGDRVKETLQRVEMLQPILCDEEVPTWTEVDTYPPYIRKNETFTLGGVVLMEGPGGAPAPGVTVEVWLNETKEEPGYFLGEAETDASGRWTLDTRIPFALEAKRYHIVNNALETMVGCQILLESWSDPEIDVGSATTLNIACPAREAPGAEFTCTARLLDEVGTGVPNRDVTVIIDGDEKGEVQTAEDGTFTIPIKFPAKASSLGNHTIAVHFGGDDHYYESFNQATVNIALATVEFQEADPEPTPIPLVKVVRGQENVIHARVDWGSASVEGRTVTVTLDGVPRTECAPSCEPLTKEVELPADGSFELTLDVPADADLEEGALYAEAPFLEKGQAARVQVVKDVSLTLDAPESQSLWSDVTAGVRLVDDEGEPVTNATVLVAHPTPDGNVTQQSLTTDGEGRATITFPALPLGAYDLTASYAGGPETTSAAANDAFDVSVPWWYWLAAGALLVGAVGLAREGKRRMDAAEAARTPPPVIPGIALSIADPNDAARTVIGVGERARVLVPHVDGAVALLVRAHEPFRAPERVEREPGDAGPLAVDVTVQEKGAGAVRVAWVDADGNVLARGAVRLRGVHYAEDVEQEYRALVGRSVSGEAAERVTPREFEAFLRDANAGIPRDSLARLVGVFEVADYSHHAVRRRDYVAFVEALRAVRDARTTDVDAHARTDRPGVTPGAA